MEHGKHIVSQEKAKEILGHGEVRGHALSEKQKGFFGARAGGAPIKVEQAKALSKARKK